jgi:hypothetical protein
MEDLVNSPPHYMTGGIETIDFIEAKGLGYHAGNVIKYLSRYQTKGNGLEDLMKAKWYLDRLINEQEVAVPSPCPMKDVAPCNLDGRNCPPACSCQKIDDWSEEKCSAPLDIIGNAWTPEIQSEIEREEQAAHDDPMQVIAQIIEAHPNLFVSAEPDPDPYCLGDFRRGGPGADWQTRPWINE